MHRLPSVLLIVLLPMACEQVVWAPPRGVPGTANLGVLGAARPRLPSVVCPPVSSWASKLPGALFTSQACPGCVLCCSLCRCAWRANRLRGPFPQSQKARYPFWFAGFTRLRGLPGTANFGVLGTAARTHVWFDQGVAQPGPKRDYTEEEATEIIVSACCI